MSKVVLSYHAEKRLKERWPHGEYLLAAEKALEYGTAPKPRYQRHFFHLGLFKEGYWTSVYKYYKGFFFIFTLNKGKYVLKTVIKWFKLEKYKPKKLELKSRLVPVKKKMSKRQACEHKFIKIKETELKTHYRCEICNTNTNILKPRP